MSAKAPGAGEDGEGAGAARVRAWPGVFTASWEVTGVLYRGG